MTDEPTCLHCGCVNGSGYQELRPYGPGGANVCAGCVFTGPPERKVEAERQLAKAFEKAGDIGVIGDGGVRAMKPEELSGEVPVPAGAVAFKKAERCIRCGMPIGFLGPGEGCPAKSNGRPCEADEEGD